MDGFLSDDVAMVQRIDIVPRILETVRTLTGMRFVAVARVTDDRWVACAVVDSVPVGLKVGDEIDIDQTFCKGVRNSHQPVTIDDASTDPVHGGSPLPKAFGFESYLSFPITLADGSVFGTLCALDPLPRALKGTAVIDTLPFFADLIAGQIDTMTRFNDTSRNLEHEKSDAELREQFIAVIGHDLRNPVASIHSGTRMLLKTPLDDHATTIVKLMQGSAMRMNGLIDNLLDFARGRLGDGMTIEREPDVALAPVLMQVIDELRSASNRVIDTDFDPDVTVSCDTQRIAQLLSNLVGNAVTHSPEGQPIVVTAHKSGGVFTLTVTNGGPAIPPAAMEALFKPFSRTDEPGYRQGLGLGLYIASEIARAHGGTLACQSGDDGTRFTLEMVG